MVILGWILTILGIVFVVIGLLLGALTVWRDLQKKAVDSGIGVEAIAIPGLGDLIKALIKTAWGQIAAVGLVLLIIGLSILGVHVEEKAAPAAAGVSAR